MFNPRTAALVVFIFGTAMMIGGIIWFGVTPAHHQPGAFHLWGRPLDGKVVLVLVGGFFACWSAYRLYWLWEDDTLKYVGCYHRSTTKGRTHFRH